MRKCFFTKALCLCLILGFTTSSQIAFAEFQEETSRTYDNRGYYWEYDPGPDVSTPWGREYAQIFARTPNYRAIGMSALANGRKSDKFRWQFGPMFYRGRLGKNQVKILIIGQEGAQDENVSDRSFTGGTGGRMQNMLSSLGIDSNYLFINTFVYTIQGQYQDYAPVLVNGSIRWRKLLTPEMIRLAQDPRSPIVAHRNQLIDHIIETNKDSLKLIIAVGDAAQDSLATYIMNKGGRCQTEDPRSIKLLNYRNVSAGGNRDFFFPVDRSGAPAIPMSAQDRSDLQNEQRSAATQQKLINSANSSAVKNRVVVRTDGPFKNGVYDPRQLGTDVETCNGGRQSLAGLAGINRDIRFIQVQHPGSNSPALQSNFAKALAQVRSWQHSGNGWGIQPDRAPWGVMPQPFDQGFRYGHKPVPRRDFRFGLPDVMGVGITTTTRRDKGQAIEYGDRASGRYPMIQDAYLPNASFLGRVNLAWEPPKQNYSEVDPGPGANWAKEFLGFNANALMSKNPMAHPRFGAKAIYRGRPENAEVLVLADQFSYDDTWVGRALMGLEGQKLQAFLESIKAGDNYLILRTLPVDTLGAPPAAISQMMDMTRSWRTRLWRKLIASNVNTLRLVITLGENAENEYQSFLRQYAPNRVDHISLNSGYSSAFSDVTKSPSWNRKGLRPLNAPIPINRKDIPYGMRMWTGTSGNRVTKAGGRASGLLYKINAPNWAVRMAPKPLTKDEAARLQALGLLH